MQVHKSGNDDLVFIVMAGQRFILLWQVFIHTGTSSLLAYHIAIFCNRQRIFGCAVANISFDYMVFHDCSFPFSVYSYMLVMTFVTSVLKEAATRSAVS